MLHLAWIAPLVLLVFFSVSPRFRGDIAQARVRRILAQGLKKNRYTVLNDLVLPAGGGTVAIDHLVVSKFGIFVIDSLYVRGWVSGSEVQERWKASRFGRTRRFDNPLHATRLQADALQQLLGFPARVFHRLVVPVGHRGFKGTAPTGVVEPEKLIPHVRRKGERVLDGEQASRALKGILDGRLEPRGGLFLKPVALLRIVLLALLAGGLYLAFGGELREAFRQWSLSAERSATPQAFHPDGSRKTPHELWEDSLRCAYSPDSGRCACYEPGGQRAELEPQRCRELAERGSVLKQ